MEVWACFICFQARDAFFRCVEADAGHTTPTEVASVGLLYPSQCKTLRANYEQLCRSTWVFPQSHLEFGFALPNHYTHWSTNLFIVFFGNSLSCDGMRWLQYWYLQICVDSLLKHRYHSQGYHWGDGSILVLLYLGEWLIWSRWSILTVSFVEGKGPSGYWIQILGHDLFHHNRRQPLGFNQVVSSVVKILQLLLQHTCIERPLFSLTASAKCRGPKFGHNNWSPGQKREPFSDRFI